MPQYIKQFYSVVGIASLSSDFIQAGCPDAPASDLANKYYTQVVPLAAPLTGALGSPRREPSLGTTDVGARCADSDSHGRWRAHSRDHATPDPAAAPVLAGQSH